MGGRIAAAFRSGVALRACALSMILASIGSVASAQPPPVTPQDFVDAAAGADQYEIRAAQTALTQSQSPAVRSFAQEMVSGHSAMVDALRDAARRSGLMPPSESVGADQAMLLSSLQGLRGTEFDRAYARQQVLAHRSALTSESSYARQGSDANLRSVATADLPTIERHLQSAQALQRSMGED